MTYTNPFNNPNSTQPPCDPTTCTPCSTATPSPTGCFICGYDHDAFQNCLNAHQTPSTPCVDGAVSCLDCTGVFPNIMFLGGYIAGFNSKLGFGASESTVSVDLVVQKHDCSVTPTPCTSTPTCTNDVYTGNLGYVYTFKAGSFCFRGILTNHSYTEDSSGYRYKVNLTDGRSILSGCSVLLNGFYGPIPERLQPNLINLVRELEPSVYDDQCALRTKCDDFTKSGSGPKGILLKKAIEALNGKQIQIPLSTACLKLNLNRLVDLISKEIRTTNQESTVLQLIELACEESGLGFFSKINNDNEMEIFPINYKIDINQTDLFKFVENFNNNDIVISKDYGQEMTLEKNKRALYGAEYCYLTLIRDNKKSYCSVTELYSDPSFSDFCKIQHAPWQQPDVVDSHPDYPIEITSTPTPPPGC